MSDKRANKSKWKRLVEYVTKIQETPLPETLPPETDKDKDEDKHADKDSGTPAEKASKP